MVSAAARRLRALAQVKIGERNVTAAVRDALTVLLGEAGRALEAAGYDTSVLDARWPSWRSTVDSTLVPAIEDVFTRSFNAASRGVIDPDVYAVRHLEAVQNRLVNVSDEVFDSMRVELAAGRAAGETIPALAARVSALLGDTERWNGRAATIARTEVISANNAGALASAHATADLLGVEHGDVARQWLATGDGRTRESHAEADGQLIVGLGSSYDVGGSSLDAPGDPGGDPGEVINCRCTELFFYPGDPEYPDELQPSTEVVPSDSAFAASGQRTGHHVRNEPMEAAVTTTAPELEPDDDETSTGVVIVALPAEDDPVQGIGDETPKHATLLYYGDVGEVAELTDDYRSTLLQTLQTYAATSAPWVEPVSGVDSLGPQGARVWMLTGPSIYGVRDAITGTDSEAMPPASVEQFPTFTPHVTIGYADVQASDAAPADDVTVQGQLDPETEAAAAAITEITFDRVALWWAGDKTIIKLGEPAATPPAPNDEAGTASMRLPVFTADGIEIGHVDMAYAVRAGFAVGDVQPPVETPVEPLADDATGPAAADMAPDGEPFYGIACPEDVMSGDNRMFTADSITWRDLPLPLMYQDAQLPGHDGAVRVGRLDMLERDLSGPKPMIRYAGVWDTSVIALEARRQVDAKVLRGVSVDCDAVQVEVVYLSSDGTVLDPATDEFPDDGIVIEQEHATAARISGLTCCSIPAFHQAYIANGDRDTAAVEPGQSELLTGPDAEPSIVLPDDAVAASGAARAASSPAWSLVAGGNTLEQPADAFVRPACLDNNPEGTPLTVTADGRVYGHLAVWGTCHIGIDGLCQEPPASESNYARYATGWVATDDGAFVATGPLVMGTGHAGLRLGYRAAAAHYDNTGTAVADVTMGQDHIGIWFAGMVRPGTTDEQVYALRASGKVSGDWRTIAGSLDLVAALVVNTPGFSIPRPAIAASAEQGAFALVAAGMVRVTAQQQQIAAGTETLLTFAEVTRAVIATLDRRERTTAAASRITARQATARRARAVAAATRITERV